MYPKIILIFVIHYSILVLKRKKVAALSKKKKIPIALVAVMLILVTFLAIILPIKLTEKVVAHIIALAGQSNCEGVSLSSELEKYIPKEKYDKYFNGIDNENIILNTSEVAVNETIF